MKPLQVIDVGMLWVARLVAGILILLVAASCRIVAGVFLDSYQRMNGRWLPLMTYTIEIQLFLLAFVVTINIALWRHFRATSRIFLALISLFLLCGVGATETSLREEYSFAVNCVIAGFPIALFWVALRPASRFTALSCPTSK